MTTYKLYTSLNGEIRNVLRDGKDSIPFDSANTDYQAFLKYQAEGGKVYGADEEVPADEVTGG